MHNRFSSSLFSLFNSRFVCVACCVLGVAAAAVADQGEFGEVQLVDLSKVDSGSGCEMVFGQVGEPFLVSFAGGEQSAALRVSEGLNAVGEVCALPKGVRFSQDDKELTGVPKRPGFYEFVVLVTEKGVTKEKVVLIDIQSDSRLSLGASYAFSFLGGVR